MSRQRETSQHPSQAFADELRAVREEAGLTKRAAADRAGVDASQWSRWENARATPYMVTLVKLADAFRLSDARLGRIVRAAAITDAA